jgi:hypothetical protein
VRQPDSRRHLLDPRAETFQADRRTGTGRVKGTVTFWITREGYIGWGGGHVSPFVVTVDRLNPDGSSTTVLVGSFYGPG